MSYQIKQKNSVRIFFLSILLNEANGVSIFILAHIIPNMDTSKSKFSVSVYMLSISRAEFVLVSSIVILHRSILNKTHI